MVDGVTFRRGNWCIHCYKTCEQSAGEKCKNPSWHAPDAVAAAESREVERRDGEVRLPYAEG